MRSTFEVMEAVKDGTEATEEELRYALHNVACWHALYMFDFARATTEDPLSDKTRRGLQRAWDTWQSGNKVPLDVRLKGSSQEPGISRDERMERGSAATADAAVKLLGALNDIRQASDPTNAGGER
jgi:hypothetical protein